MTYHQMQKALADYCEVYSPADVLAHLLDWAHDQEREGRAEGDSRWEEAHGRYADLFARAHEELQRLPKP